MVDFVEGTMSQKSALTNLATIAVLATALTALLFVVNVGVGEIYQAVVNPADTANPLAPETMAAFGGDVGTLDRIVALGMVATIVGPAGLGLYSAGRNDPQMLRSAETWMPWLVGAIGLVSFWATSVDILTGNYDFTIGDSNENLFLVYVAFSMLVGILGFLGYSARKA